ncbi:hypothetical protein [Pseudobutyrivibrio sp.]
MEKTRYNQKDIAVVGLMIALVFIGTFYFKIPTAFGYTYKNTNVWPCLCTIYSSNP